MCEVVRTAMWKQCWQSKSEEVQLKLRLVCDRMNSRQDCYIEYIRCQNLSLPENQRKSFLCYAGIS